MAMTLPIAIPATPSAGNSSSDESAHLSPNNVQTLALPADQVNIGQQLQHPGGSQMKRKPSRRANTAERRATHNAVERQRRETLNGRFLDLAALLPNLSQIRRPSKSSIVNSSIAHIHASRRHRLLASRELRLVKLESDALRRELNEWRDRAGLPRVEEPVRGEGFAMVLSGEVEVLAAVIDEEDEGYDGDDYGDDYNGAANTQAAEEAEDLRMSQSAAAQMLKNANSNPFAHNLPSNNNNHMHGHISNNRPRSGPMIASSPTGVSFENPAMASLYEPSHGPYSAQFMQQGMGGDDSKFAAWNAQLYSALGNSHPSLQAQQRALFTPPASAMSSAPPSSAGSGGINPFSDPEMLASFHRQQQVLAMQQQQAHAHMYGSPPDRDDASSVGSAVSGRRQRERSGSASGHSGYGSPQHGSPLGHYELGTGVEHSDYGMPKRYAGALQINTSVNGQWAGRGGESAVDGMGGNMKQMLSPPISVGGGGNGNGFAMMMM
ncbi:hypothetical protein FIBSPDRAFT_778964 [Athelia psychrophila]|uniref:BHLH domain-containing protein n=1 Tax=Athelia psychrophila TaxID=1759441 RepID=A0A166S700_9AGAM|nr:hypothetical protein FIBSPDRAFT_778964 [Fibularhizoctonia sp. CBS 109695]